MALLKRAGQARIQRGIVHFSEQIGQSAHQRTRYFVGLLDARELLQTVVKLAPELIIIHLGSRDANHGEPRGQALAAGELIERRQELAPC